MATQKNSSNGSKNDLGATTTSPVLEDRDHKVIDRYGILDPDGPGWPHPATYIIDQRGTVRWKFIEVDYTKRPSNEQVLGELRKLK